jgi:succinate dehydrogenase / fumarate reductase flavoprotein subunit
MPSLSAADPEERRREAERWCDRFDEGTRRWLKTTIAEWTGDDVRISYEEVDTSLIPPRPRLYGLVGADVITEVWKERQKRAALGGNGAPPVKEPAAAKIGA